MRVIIVGGGKVGARLAALLLQSGTAVRVVETARGECLTLRRQLQAEAVVEGNGTDPVVLETAGIRQADVVAAVTGADETNLVVASLARFEFNVRRVIARVNDPANAWMFTPRMGVSTYLDQADLLAHLIAEEMSLGEMMTLLKLRRGEYSLVEERVHSASAAADRAVGALALPRESVVVAVIRGGSLLIPRGDLLLQPGDEVLALVHAAEAGRLAALLGAPEIGPKEG